jgi:hypothetical protein
VLAARYCLLAALRVGRMLHVLIQAMTVTSVVVRVFETARGVN